METQNTTTSTPRTGRLRMYAALLLAFAVLLGTMLTLTYQSYRREQSDRLARGAESIRDAIDATLTQQSDAMLAKLSILSRSQTLARAMEAGDRDTLLQEGEPILADIIARSNVTHLYFHAVDGTNFLRVHEPSHHSDRIGRVTMRRAMETGEPTVGNEPGPYGRFTLRAVTPWRVDGRLIGYLELGAEYEDITREIAGSRNLEIVVAVNKSALDENLWRNTVKHESEKRGVEPLTSWEDYPHVAVVFSSSDVVPPEADTVLSRVQMGSQSNELIRSGDGRDLQVICDMVPDVHGKGAGSLVALRDVTAEIAAAQRKLTVVAAISAVVCGALLVAFCFAFDRIHNRIDRQATELRKAYDELQRTAKERESLQQKLVVASREAGMAEVATGVLHNVGNVLNSVNVSAGVIDGQLRSSKVSSLVRAGEMLREHSDDLSAFLTEDERGRLLPGFLSELATHLVSERDAMQQEVASLSKGVDHIRSIVANQQGVASNRSVLEQVNPAELIESALELQQDAFVSNDVAIDRDYAKLEPVSMDRHRVLQILTNLISNAKHALADVEPSSRRLTLRVSEHDDAAGRTIRFEVSDSGSGIAPEDQSRVFNHGFTTKSSGHGFGLHTAATAAQAMKGSLTVHSDGPGKGASFVLTLPADAQTHARGHGRGDASGLAA